MAAQFRSPGKPPEQEASMPDEPSDGLLDRVRNLLAKAEGDGVTPHEAEVPSWAAWPDGNRSLRRRWSRCAHEGRPGHHRLAGRFRQDLCREPGVENRVVDDHRHLHDGNRVKSVVPNADATSSC